MFRDHSQLNTPHSAWLLWTSDRTDVTTCTSQHTTLTRDRHPCLRRYSNPQSQQSPFYTGYDFRGKNFIKHKTCFVIFSATFAWKSIILRKFNEIPWMWKDRHENARYSYQILIKLAFSRYILEKHSNIKFHVNPSCGSRVVPCGQTDRPLDRETVTHTHTLDEANRHFSQFFEHA